MWDLQYSRWYGVDFWKKKVLRLLQFSFPVTIKPMLFFFTYISAHLCDRSEELTGYNDVCPQLHFHL
jgi:hypothetical protein